MTDITAPRFKTEAAARKHLEKIRWPDGPVCPHCGSIDNASKLKANKKAKVRPGLWFCGDCRTQFTVTVGTVFERSKVPLHKWLLANHLINSSKKGISSHQLARMLGVTYKTAWFMSHRIREAMRDPKPDPVGGQNKVVEVDETYVGGKAKNRAFAPPPKKEAVMGLVEREGKLRMFHVPEVTSKTLRPIMVSHIDRGSYLMTDESTVYPAPGEEFAGHGTVNHSAKEYVRATFWHTNTIECAFSLLKRGITGTYHHVSQKHLRRYLGEFDFRFNHKDISDSERADIALKGIEGKRLTYRPIAAGA